MFVFRADISGQIGKQSRQIAIITTTPNSIKYLSVCYHQCSCSYHCSSIRSTDQLSSITNCLFAIQLASADTSLARRQQHHKHNNVPTNLYCIAMINRLLPGGTRAAISLLLMVGLCHSCQWVPVMTLVALESHSIGIRSHRFVHAACSIVYITPDGQLKLHS